MCSATKRQAGKGGVFVIPSRCIHRDVELAPLGITEKKVREAFFPILHSARRAPG